MVVDKEALPVASLLGLVTLVAGLLLHPVAALPPLALLLFTLWFFRDPRREPPPCAATLVSPADGKVIVAEADRLSVFMNVFDVHVCRSPMAGRLGSVERHPGRFMAAFRDAASEHNERAVLRLFDEDRSLTVTLVAGLVARRIVLRVREAQEIRRGERIGLIRFGSRVDVRLPAGATILVAVGDRVRAGASPIARLGPGGEAFPL
jgi:phosphatidylserine decarboxylase